VIGAAGYRHRLTSGRLKDLQAEKNGILERLRDREAKVEVLQQELLGLESKQAKDRSESLQMEIRRYKAEIRTLSARADDLVPYAPTGENAEALEFEGIRGDNRGPMKPIADMVMKIADSEAPVLILGESGTGKELVARALHKKSQRASGPFVPVNCGALSETLLESELFGHEKGAFTGAMKEKPGRFELADGGTIFLDEIGEVTENFQVKLLRVLQEGEVERVGGTRTIHVNVRLLAATNRDLKGLIASKRFREDLYYRLNVLSIELPALRERVVDIPELVRYFLSRDGHDLRVSQNVLNAFEHYAWPGNVRELESVVKRGVLLAKADGRSMVTMQDLGEEIRSAIQGAITLEEQILQSLREKGFSRNAISVTAVELGGLNRGTVAEYLRGECLQAVVDHGFDLEKTVRAISLTNDAEVNQRVTKRITDYLANLSDGMDMSQPWEHSNALLRSKVKNLPQRYHQSAERVAEGIFRGLWKA
jgi:transcriptional regulator with PAS, ATPase and Fis domain